MGTIEPRTFTLKTGETCVVRAAVEPDAAPLIDQRRAMTRDPLNITAPDEFDMTVEQETARIREHAEKEGWAAIVAVVGDEDVGFLTLGRSSRRRLAHRGTFAMGVRKAWRGRGVGDALLTTLMDWAVAHPELEKVNLAVLAVNEPARKLYEKHGFLVEGRCPRQIKLDDGTYVDDVIMYRFVDG